MSIRICVSLCICICICFCICISFLPVFVLVIWLVSIMGFLCVFVILSVFVCLWRVLHSCKVKKTLEVVMVGKEPPPNVSLLVFVIVFVFVLLYWYFYLSGGGVLQSAGEHGASSSSEPICLNSCLVSAATGTLLWCVTTTKNLRATGWRVGFAQRLEMKMAGVEYLWDSLFWSWPWCDVPWCPTLLPTPMTARNPETNI